MGKIKTQLGLMAVVMLLASCATKAPQQTQTGNSASTRTAGARDHIDQEKINNSPQLKKEQSATLTKPVDR